MKKILERKDKMEVRFNKHGKNVIEFNVKLYGLDFEIPSNLNNEDVEIIQSTFIEYYSIECFNKIKKLKYDWVVDYYFMGRAGGWFCIETKPDIDYVKKSKQIDKITEIVESYYNNYNNKFKKCLEEASARKEG